MSDQNVRPSAMSRYQELEEEERFLSGLRKSARRVKIDNGHTWQMRILPYQTSAEKKPYIRLAQHWWNNTPTTCPTWTPAAWGGDPDHLCPICEMSERLNDSNDEIIRNMGYRAKVVPRYRFWVVVFDKEDNRGNIDEMPIEEILNPYEFDMYQGTFEYYKKFQKWASRGRGKAEPSEWGMLDLDTGFNVLATHGNKGVTLDRCEPSPIFDDKDPNFDKNIEVIWKRIKEPKIQVPSDRVLLELAEKIEEYIERKASGNDRGRGRGDEPRGRGRGRGRDDFGDEPRGRGRDDFGDEPRGRGRGRDDFGDEPRGRGRGCDDFGDEPRGRGRAPEDDAPPPRRRAVQEADEGSAPPARRREAPEPEREADAPPPRRRQEEAADTASSPPPRRRQEEAAEAPSNPPPRRNQRESVGGEDNDPDNTTSPPTRRRQEETRQEPPKDDTRQEPPKAAEGDDGDLGPMKRQSRGHPGQGVGVDENEDNAPEERRDPAPPTKEKLATDDAPPPPVRSNGPTPRTTRDTGAMAARLNRISQKE